MLASRDRAAGAAARAAILRGETGAPPVASPHQNVAAPAAPIVPAVPPIAAAAGDEPVDASAPKRGSEAGGPVDADTMARLREAKRRARGG
jgi:hypothetical protein